MFLVAVLLLCTVGAFGIVFEFVYSVFTFSREKVIEWWADIFRELSVGIDKIGCVLLKSFLNITCLKDKTLYPFGNVRHTISHVLAVNLLRHNNITRFGKIIIWVLENRDPGHMQKSL